MNCEDGDPCTKGEKCSSGACVGGQPFDCCFSDDECEDFEKCTYNKCNLSAHDCEFPLISDCCGNAAKEEGEDCDDGNDDEFDGCNSECKLSEFTVTTEAGFEDYSMNPSLADDSQGNYFMLFEALKGGGKEGIWCRKFDGEAGEFGKPFQVSEFLSGDHNNPHITPFGSDLIAGWLYGKYKKFRLLNADGVKGGELTVVDLVEEGKPAKESAFFNRVISIDELEGKNLALAAWMQDDSSQSETIPEWNVHYALLKVGNDGKLALAANPKSLAGSWKKMMPAVAASDDSFAIIYIALDPSDPYKYENRIAAIDKDGILIKESAINQINFAYGHFAAADGLFDPVKKNFIVAAPAITKNGEEIDTMLDVYAFDKTATIQSGGYGSFSDSGVYIFFALERLENDFLIAYYQFISDVSITAKYRRMDAAMNILSAAEQLSSTQDFANIGVSAAPLGDGFFAVWTVTDFNTFNIHGRVIK
ncbi:MAG: hypothetical protein FJ088_08295 [Deltaproteobacteria bacterium]|nr:hypothetical protein [Deltaproteobacteria bacterium]